LSIAAHASIVTESVISEWKRVLVQELNAGLGYRGASGELPPPKPRALSR
jgi:hypothetical protein